MQIKFKASRRKSKSCDGYRQLIKSGDLEHDITRSSDDVIILNVKGTPVHIDCDKKTGVYRVYY